jgi:hypothetical protein
MGSFTKQEEYLETMTCDSCGKETTCEMWYNGDGYNIVKVFKHSGYPLHSHSDGILVEQSKDYDFCPECFDKVEKIMEETLGIKARIYRR